MKLNPTKVANVANFIIDVIKKLRIYKGSKMSASQTILVFESLDSTNGDPHNSKWVLDTPVRNIVSFRIQDFEVPFSYHPVNSYNYAIRFTDNVPNTYNITLTAGVYSPDELATEIQTQMNAAMVGFTVTYNESTMKFTIANASQFEILTTGTSATRLLGLSGDTWLVTSWESDNVIDLSYTRHILVESNLASMINSPKVNGQTSHIIHRFACNGNPGDVLIEQGRLNAMFRVTDQRRQLSEVTMRIVDDAGNEIDLNGLGFTCTLLVEYMQD